MLKRAIGYAEYRDLLDVFVDSVQQEQGDQVVYRSVACGTAEPEAT